MKKKTLKGCSCAFVLLSFSLGFVRDLLVTITHLCSLTLSLLLLSLEREPNKKFLLKYNVKCEKYYSKYIFFVIPTDHKKQVIIGHEYLWKNNYIVHPYTIGCGSIFWPFLQLLWLLTTRCNTETKILLGQVTKKKINVLVWLCC